MTYGVPAFVLFLSHVETLGNVWYIFSSIC